jgi:site-specific recombinase XerD
MAELLHAAFTDAADAASGTTRSHSRPGPAQAGQRVVPDISPHVLGSREGGRCTVRNDRAWDARGGRVGTTGDLERIIPDHDPVAVIGEPSPADHSDAHDTAHRHSDLLAMAVAGFLGRYRSQSRVHAASDLRVFLTWCDEHGLDPLDPSRVGRVQAEAFIRWMQETRRFKPSTVSRRVSVVAGFYRTAVIDGLTGASPVQHVRRPRVPPESPTLGLSHLQFEAMLVAARQSTHASDFALVCFLGLRIFEACAADVTDLGEEHGHRVLRVVGKGGRVTLVPLPPAVSRAVDRAIAGRTSGPILLNHAGRRMDRHAATRRLHHLADTAGVRMPRMHPHI